MINPSSDLWMRRPAILVVGSCPGLSDLNGTPQKSFFTQVQDLQVKLKKLKKKVGHNSKINLSTMLCHVPPELFGCALA